MVVATDGGQDAARSPADTQRRAQLVARVGDTTITVGQFEDLLNEAPAPVRAAYRAPERQREFLENMIGTLLLAQEARRRGVDRQPDVSSAIRRILSQRVQQIEVLDSIRADQISDADVRAYYQAHVEDFQQPEFRRATMIVLTDRASADAVAVLARAARGDMRRVQTLVRERSVDARTREHEGDLFYFRREGGGTGDQAVDPAVAAAAFALQREMEVTPPVATRDGRFALAVLTGIRPALNRALDEPGVSASIRGRLVRERRERREREFIEGLRARANPEIHEERVEQVRWPTQDLGNVPPFDPADRVPRRNDTPGNSAAPAIANPNLLPPSPPVGPRTP